MAVTRVLVVGYGNPLRGDDGAGPAVAERLREAALPGVEVVTAHQLLPELAERLSTVDEAYFVDASEDAAELVCRTVAPAQAEHGVGHTGDAGWLLGLAEALYGNAPRAWLVAIPTQTFEFGQTLSPLAQDGVEQAAALIRGRIGGGVESRESRVDSAGA